MDSLERNKGNIRIVLASGSPRRRELLAQAGYTFSVEVSQADENVNETDPFRLVEELSRRKAMAVADHYMAASGTCCGSAPESGDGHAEYLIIGADTIVVLDGKILGKPSGQEDAFAMLRSLSGRTHQVCTGVTLLLVRGGKLERAETFHEKTDVVMRDLDDREIRDYIATGDPLDKAGAYGIQGMAGTFIPEIHGDYYNVVGLPLSRTLVGIRKMQG